MNNKRNLLEVETMNETTLQDLLDLSAKVQTSVLQLQNSALKFNNKRLQILATKLNSDSGTFHTLVSELVMAGDVNSNSMPGDKADTRQSLEQPRQITNDESVKQKYLKRKQLREAEDVSVEDKPQASEADVVIDLTEPFNKVINGLDDDEFSDFKSDVVDKLEDHIDSVENKVSTPAADEYSKTIEALDAANSAEDFDFALNRLYDFADKNEIIVETVVNKKKILSKKKILTEEPYNDSYAANVLAAGPRELSSLQKEKPRPNAARLKIEPESKDYMRIDDMARKAKDHNHMLRLATQMAMSITDYSKAIRRCRAAEDDNWHDVAKIFMDRADQILSQNSN